MELPKNSTIGCYRNRENAASYVKNIIQASKEDSVLTMITKLEGSEGFYVVTATAQSLEELETLLSLLGQQLTLETLQST